MILDNVDRLDGTVCAELLSEGVLIGASRDARNVNITIVLVV